MRRNENLDVVNYDDQGNVIDTAFPVSDRTRRNQSKTSVGYTLIAVLLHILAFVPIIAVSIVLAVKCYNLVPYYSFWPFVGVIVVGLFGLIFLVVSLCVTRKKSKSNIAMQTTKIAITFTCLTTVFALLLTYIVPDVISMATQSTLFVEDLYYNGDAQAEVNAKLDRDFIMYNLLNGNLNDHKAEDGKGDYSYKTLAKMEKVDEVHYLNDDIENGYNKYMAYSTSDANDIKALDGVLSSMQQNQPRKYELYQFVYKTYVLNDYDYAFVNTLDRRAFALSVVDYVYANANYESLLKQGFSNKKIKQLFDDNFDNFNHDGYQTFDDAMLLYAQMEGRMTIPVVLRLILNEGWSYSQGATDSQGNLQYSDDGNFLYEMYDPEAKAKFDAQNGEYSFMGKLLGSDGVEYEANYGFNSDGWMIFENGIVKRPINWLVLDMLGDPMDLTTLNINSLLGGVLGGIMGGAVPEDMVGSVLANLLKSLSGVVNSIGGLVQDDLAEVIKYATGGANLNINLCIDDSGALAISISPMNAQYGMLGYMQASWVQSNNLLMAVINVIGLRNWLCIFGAVGVVLVIAAGIVRECGKRTRMRTAVARDRIIRAQTADRIASGEETPEAFDEHGELAAGLSAYDVAEIERAQQRKPKRNADDLDDLDDIDIDNMELTEEELALLAEDEEERKPKKKRFGKKEKPVEDDLDNIELTDEDLALLDEEPEEKPKKKRFGKKEKPVEENLDDVQLTDEDLALLDEEPEEKPKKKRFGKKEKPVEENLDDVQLTDEDLALLDEEPEEKPKKKRFGKKKQSDDFDFDSEDAE